MKLRSKTMLNICLIFLGLVLMLYWVNKAILMNSFAELEERDARINVERALNALQGEIDSLAMVARDWAGCDDTYAFMNDYNEQYINSNLADRTFQNLQIDALILADNSGHIVSGQGYNWEINKITPLSEGLERHIAACGTLVSHWSVDGGRAGIIILPEGPMLVASYPVLTSAHEGPAHGSLIMGRFLDQTAIRQLSERTNLLINFNDFRDGSVQDDVIEKLQNAPAKKNYYVKPLDDLSIAGYVVVKDIYNKNGIIMQVNTPREIYRQGETSLLHVFITLLIAGLIFGVVVWQLVEKIILGRLEYLSNSVYAIGDSGDFSARVIVSGKDELSVLANSINVMLGALEQSQQNLRESEGRFRLLAENARDVVYRLQLAPDFKFEYVSPALYSLTGYTPEEYYADPSVIYKLVPANAQCLIDNLMSGTCQLRENVTMQWIHKDGRVIWLEHSIVPIYDHCAVLIALEGIARDITDRKEMEEQLKYFSLYDSLTGLYNRAHFEMEMRRLETGRHSLGLIVCDVDGLKLVNDTLGHDTGDKLLQLVAGVIKESLRKRDIVARMGGDEFAVLLPHSDEKTVEGVCGRIRKAVAGHNAVDPELPLSMSIGFAVNDKSNVNWRDIYKEADNNMYREKLHHKQSVRSAIVKTLMKALEARDFITEGHADRLQDLVANMAGFIGMPEHSVTDLRLLAQFHDIGKVGIPDNILFKPDPLTREEAEQMQRHCEIGHRIALSSPDLGPIAEWILSHHEWWNGGGYPLGLKGEEIPLACRMLAIADAYDAMTSDRPYRKAISSDEALAELQRCAGTQFDPALVRAFIESMGEM